MPSSYIDPFHNNLRAVLLRDLAERKDNLCNNMASNIEAYRFMCGQIVAIQQILERCEEVETAMYVGRTESEADEE